MGFFLPKKAVRVTVHLTLARFPKKKNNRERERDRESDKNPPIGNSETTNRREMKTKKNRTERGSAGHDGPEGRALDFRPALSGQKNQVLYACVSAKRSPFYTK